MGGRLCSAPRAESSVAAGPLEARACNGSENEERLVCVVMIFYGGGVPDRGWGGAGSASRASADGAGAHVRCVCGRVRRATATPLSARDREPQRASDGRWFT